MHALLSRVTLVSAVLFCWFLFGVSKLMVDACTVVNPTLRK